MRNQALLLIALASDVCLSLPLWRLFLLIAGQLRLLYYFSLHFVRLIQKKMLNNPISKTQMCTSGEFTLECKVHDYFSECISALCQTSARTASKYLLAKPPPGVLLVSLGQSMTAASTGAVCHSLTQWGQNKPSQLNSARLPKPWKYRKGRILSSTNKYEKS